MDRPVVDLAKVEIKLLTSEDDTQGFCCGDADLDDFIRTDALANQKLDVVRVYVARYEGELAGFVAPLSDCVILQQSERKKLGKLKHPSVPAMKIGRLATSLSFKERYRGMGETMVGFSLAVGTRMAREAGCRLLTVDAYSQSVGFYEKLGFLRNKAAGKRPFSIRHAIRKRLTFGRDDGERISMRFDIRADPPPKWGA
jgi:hypothetical protein